MWAVVPLLLVGYIRQSIAARRIQPELSLRKLESIELDRAVLLYEKVCNRLKDFDQQLEHAKANASWWARHRRRAQIRRQYGDELADLEAYAHHLRSTIIRLRRRPIRRFKA
ncbi:MAG TPA: hypothetical protein VHG27_09490, partial [Xanthobacteraceae bacterium]|nr:hypothetical protein [Xanthobacteraceae bacterium]